jgi:hypothetical protein
LISITAGHHTRSGGVAKQQRVRTPFADRVCALVPLLFAVPVIAGMVVTAGHLVALAHPLIGYGSTLNGDAGAMYFGDWPYRDPAQGYFADGYTPLYAMTVAALHHVHYWSGWPVIVTLVSGAGLVAIAARLAYTDPGRRVLGVVEAAGIGALAWSFADTVHSSLLYEGRPDQFAYALAFGGLLLLPRALHSRRAAIAMVVLLSAGYWAKQPTLIVPVAACAAALVATLGDWPRFRRVVAVTAVAALANGAILGALALATGGWQVRINYGIHLPVAYSLWFATGDFLSQAALPLLVLAGLCALAARTGSLRRPDLGSLRAAPLTLALVVTAVLGAASGIWLRRYWGGGQHNYIGALWALGLLVALAYRAARRSRHAALRLAAAMTVVAATTLLGGSWTLRHGDVLPAQSFTAVPSDVVAYARTHVMYEPLYADLNMPWRNLPLPNQSRIDEALERGIQPRWFVDMLLGRRFDWIGGYFAADIVDRELALNPRAEDSYFWKLNLVLESEYVASRRVPATLPNGLNPTRSAPALVPRRGPGLSPGLRWCFAPFSLAGVAFEIGDGGGLWCSRAGSDRVEMNGTPAPVTELHSARGVVVGGGSLAIRVEPRRDQSWSVELEDRWRVRGIVRGDLSGMDVAVSVGDGAPVVRALSRAELRTSGGIVTLAFGPARARPALVRLPQGGGGRMVIRASRDARIAVGFGAARLAVRS